MTPREAVLKIRNSSQNVRLRSLCTATKAGSIPGIKRKEIDRLVCELDTTVKEARSRLSGDDLLEFERQLWKETRCYWLLSDLRKELMKQK
jgi:hypothetical protein